MVDHDSADNSVAFTKENYPTVLVIEEKSNWGFAKGNNLGIKEALKDPDIRHIVLLNTDARIAPDWLETMSTFAGKKPKGACFQGTTLDYYDDKIIDSTHIYVSHNSQATQGNWRKPYINEIGPKKVFGVNAAACLINRDFIEAQPYNDFFDEQMFMYLEDVDVAARATVMGWDNYLVPSARAFHMGSASSGKNPDFSLYLTFRNNLGMIIKNFPLPIVWKLLIAMPRSDRATIRHLKRQGNKNAAQLIVKARAAGLFGMHKYLYKRSKLSRLRDIDEGYLWRLMSKGY